MFDEFIRHGLDLTAWSPKTVRTYRQAFSSLQQSQRQSLCLYQRYADPAQVWTDNSSICALFVTWAGIGRG
jgi:hypothetical protein